MLGIQLFLNEPAIDIQNQNMQLSFIIFFTELLKYVKILDHLRHTLKEVPHENSQMFLAVQLYQQKTFRIQAAARGHHSHHGGHHFRCAQKVATPNSKQKGFNWKGGKPPLPP